MYLFIISSKYYNRVNYFLNFLIEHQQETVIGLNDEHIHNSLPLVNNKTAVNTLDFKCISDRVIDRAIHTVTIEFNQMQSQTMNVIKADVEPIVGYAAEPLLPLVKACTPLNDILHNLPFYVQLALNETLEIPPDQLTIDESAAIRLYTMEWERPRRSLYSMLNHTLKKGNREELRPYFKYMKLFMTALIKLPCAPPLTIWRGITKDQSAEFPPGTAVTWWSFSSCTTELGVLENNMYLGNSGDRTLFSVEAINARIIRDHSHFVTEDEILLLPGTHMIVQSQFSPASELHIIHLKQVMPEEMLLEPPFEGNQNILPYFSQFGIYLTIGAKVYPKIK